MFPSTSLVGFRMGGVLLLLVLLRLRGGVAAMLIRRWASSNETDLLLFTVTVDASSFSMTFPHTRLIFSMMVMMMMMMHRNFDISIIPCRGGGGRAR